MKKVSELPVEYQAAFGLLLDSGLRLIETEILVNNFTTPEPVGEFYRHDLALFRGCKQAFYAYFTKSTEALLAVNTEYVSARNLASYFRKKGLISPKYIRKFVFDKMVELEVPESVADFIEGRRSRAPSTLSPVGSMRSWPAWSMKCSQ